MLLCYERFMYILFLVLLMLTLMKFYTADDLSTHQSGEEVSVTGLNSILPKEHGNKFYNLPIIRHLEKDVCAIAAWDSSIHDNVHLNRVTDGNNFLHFIKQVALYLCNVRCGFFSSKRKSFSNLEDYRSPVASSTNGSCAA